jgi:hypothetical protein
VLSVEPVTWVELLFELVSVSGGGIVSDYLGDWPYVMVSGLGLELVFVCVCVCLYRTGHKSVQNTASYGQ